MFFSIREEFGAYLCFRRKLNPKPRRPVPRRSKEVGSGAETTSRVESEVPALVAVMMYSAVME